MKPRSCQSGVNYPTLIWDAKIFLIKGPVYFSAIWRQDLANQRSSIIICNIKPRFCQSGVQYSTQQYEAKILPIGGLLSYSAIWILYIAYKGASILHWKMKRTFHQSRLIALLWMLWALLWWKYEILVVPFSAYCELCAAAAQILQF